MKKIVLVLAILVTSQAYSQIKTIFRYACDGNIEKVDSLLQTVDINTKSENNSNLLHFATYCKQEKLVDILIDKGIDINAKNNFGDTPLMYAVLRRDVKTTKNSLRTSMDT